MGASLRGAFRRPTFKVEKKHLATKGFKVQLLRMYVFYCVFYLKIRLWVVMVAKTKKETGPSVVVALIVGGLPE